MANEIDVLVKTMIETQIIQALHGAPEAIDKLVKAALSRPVDKNGNFEGDRMFVHGSTTPYLDWMVGQEVREAAKTAARKVIREKTPDIEDAVRRGLSSESLVAAVVRSLVDTAGQDWRINVVFEADKG